MRPAASRSARIRVGVDVGGTFTDLVAVMAGRLVTAKVPSTPADQSLGVLAALQAAGLPGAAADAVASLTHGTTVATNALLERSGARTALLTTEGFRDVIEIGRQNRPSLYDLTRGRPVPLVPRPLRFVVRERMGATGVVAPLDEGRLAEVVTALRQADVEAVAVCLLFSFLHPAHEHRVGEMLRAQLPDVHISLSSELLPEFREYERTATTVADAYLTPLLARYLKRLADRLNELGMPEPLVMQSSGGVADAGRAAQGAARFVLSGPAAGVVGATWIAGCSGFQDLLTLDMGGTSTDVAPVLGGTVQTTTESVIAGVPIKFPMVDVRSVGAGGGSVAWVDSGGALRIGPQSAGAEPGPACYGRGGPPTVTDANLVLGMLAPRRPLGGDITLRPDLAEAALEGLAEETGLPVAEVAQGVVRVAEAEMVRALRVISIERGLDPRGFALVAFGGAGGLHACALAAELGVRTVLVPAAGGVLSALGLAISDLRRDYVQPLPGPIEELKDQTLDAAFAALERVAAGELAESQVERRADLRYRGQSYELTVTGRDRGELASAFEQQHARRYGYHMPGEEIELVTVRLVAAAPTAKPVLEEPGGPASSPATQRPVHIDGRWQEVSVITRTDMGRGSRVAGPAIVELADATCLVRPGWTGAVDAVGTLVLRRDDHEQVSRR